MDNFYPFHYSLLGTTANLFASQGGFMKMNTVLAIGYCGQDINI